MADELDNTLAHGDPRSAAPELAEPAAAHPAAAEAGAREPSPVAGTAAAPAAERPQPTTSSSLASDDGATGPAVPMDATLPLPEMAEEREAGAREPSPSPSTAAAPAAERPQPTAEAPSPVEDSEATIPAVPVAVTMPLPKMVEAPDAPEPGMAPEADAAPSLHEVGSTFANWAKGRTAAVGTFFSRHRLMVVVTSLACVAAVLAAVLWGMNASQVPPDSLISSDAYAHLSAPAHTASSYEIDEPLVLQTVEVARKRTSDTRKDACDVDVVATFANSGMETIASAQLTYVREGDTWNCTAASVDNASHHATAGVSQKRLLEHLDELLDAANRDDATVSLSTLYHDASVEIVSDNFIEDAQTDSLILRCASQGTFVNYACDLTVHFRFVPASGAWELVEAIASDDAYDLSFGPLVGTWQGTFSQQSSTSQKCLAAKQTGLTVTIDKAAIGQDGEARIEGSLSGVAHLHPDLEENADTTMGDEELHDVPFAGRIFSGEVAQDVVSLLAGNNPKRDVSGIVFECATQEMAHGNVTLTLTFGTSSAPDAASATLTSTHTYDDYFLLLVPYQRDARFADTFTLEKVA